MVGFNKKTVKDFNFDGKRALLRADYNVPVIKGKIADDFRIKQSIDTIKYILGHPGASLVIISHLGRPKSADDKDCSLKPVAEHLGKLLDRKVQFATDCIGEAAKSAADQLGEHQILVLENVRFHPEEEKNDESFAKAIVEASGAEVFVQDGFGVVHRAHASTEAITRLLPSVAGLLLANEVETITKVIEEPARPLVSIVGGAKISDKIEVLNKLIDLSDCVAVVGAMANDFLLAEGVKIGKSLAEPKLLDTTRGILERAKNEEKHRNFSFLTPVDVVVSTKADGRAPTRVVDVFGNNLADIEAYPKLPKPAAYSVEPDEIILDIGPASAAQIAGAIRLANTVIWNGTCGVTETKGIAGAADPFAHGTHTIVEAMIGDTNKHANRPFTLVGGGDTVSYVEEQGLTEDFGFVSTGGGASLELISGHKLPGVEALENKN
ncbi:MAG TPA: phosphoglycerate kinase [Candidatus Saccharimonadales bacterium]|nr:phosphoglycerate kinase [Candidatus Saccharimonadales bacterium]